MLNMRGVNQGDEQVCIQQERHQGNSSRSRLTSSGVTGDASGPVGSSGTPLRVAPQEDEGRNACLASAEITSPRVQC
jgi:hypothetical protein